MYVCDETAVTSVQLLHCTTPIIVIVDVYNHNRVFYLAGGRTVSWEGAIFIYLFKDIS